MAMTYLTKLKPEPMGEYSLSTAYGVNSLVMSEDGATAYISVKDVPAGTPLTNTEYWKIHTDLTAVKQSADAAAQRANAARGEMLEIARNLTDAVEKSGNPVQAELVGGMPFDRVTTALSPIQAGSGDPSPDNIRPISGWTGAKLNHTNDSGLEHPYTADFGQTVYGGTLDWQTGVLTADRAFYTFDGSEAFINPDWTNPYAYVLWNLFPDVVNYGWDDTADAYCSHYIVRSVVNVITNAIAGFGIYDSGNLIFSSPTHADADAFKSYLAAQYAAGTPVQVCYKLATPTTIQLTPQEIKQMQGMNTLYGDGSISMTGRADKALALDVRIAALEAAALAE